MAILCWAAENSLRGTVAMTTFWHTFHHDGKISPTWWGWGVHALPLSLYLLSRVVVYTPAERADSTPISPLPLYVLCGADQQASTTGVYILYMSKEPKWGLLFAVGSSEFGFLSAVYSAEYGFLLAVRSSECGFLLAVCSPKCGFLWAVRSCCREPKHTKLLRSNSVYKIYNFRGISKSFSITLIFLCSSTNASICVHSPAD